MNDRIERLRALARGDLKREETKKEAAAREAATKAAKNEIDRWLDLIEAAIGQDKKWVEISTEDRSTPPWEWAEHARDDVWYGAYFGELRKLLGKEFKVAGYQGWSERNYQFVVVKVSW